MNIWDLAALRMVFFSQMISGLQKENMRLRIRVQVLERRLNDEDGDESITKVSDFLWLSWPFAFYLSATFCFSSAWIMKFEWTNFWRSWIWKRKSVKRTGMFLRVSSEKNWSAVLPKWC